jgi:superfamily II DNA/RNA helicase
MRKQVVEFLLRRRPNVSRADGTCCIILAPTRELALQIFQSLHQLIVQGAFYWIVAGQLAGA